MAMPAGVGMAASGGYTYAPMYPFVAAPYFYPQNFTGEIVPGLEEIKVAVRDQVEYYFSPENLTGDIFMRQKMSDQGWIPVYIIANFRRVKLLTPDYNLVAEALAGSQVRRGLAVECLGGWSRVGCGAGLASPARAGRECVMAIPSCSSNALSSHACLVGAEPRDWGWDIWAAG